jgi:hypothetical protein
MRIARGVALVAFVGLGSFSVACSRGAQMDKPVDPGQQGPFVRLERSACYGICPVYSLLVQKDGSVAFDGQQHVKFKGHASDRLTADQVSRLRSAFEAARFDTFHDGYESPTITDRSTIVIAFTAGDTTKTVRHDLGDKTAPPELEKLENDVDAIVGVERWTGTAEERAKHAADWH